MKALRIAGVGAAALAMAASALPAQADIVEVAWDSTHHFERQLIVAPKKMLELCDRLMPGTKVRWKYEAGVPMAFNVHFHDRDKVVFAAREERSRSASGVLDVSVEQDYCWTWTSDSTNPAAVTVKLTKER